MFKLIFTYIISISFLAIQLKFPELQLKSMNYNPEFQENRREMFIYNEKLKNE